MTVKQATRMQLIQPFHVMALLARARELEAAGRSVIHMEIGEPDFVTPQPLIDAGIKALQDGHTHYTPATGLAALREKKQVSRDGATIYKRINLTTIKKGGIEK